MKSVLLSIFILICSTSISQTYSKVYNTIGVKKLLGTIDSTEYYLASNIKREVTISDGRTTLYSLEKGGSRPLILNNSFYFVDYEYSKTEYSVVLYKLNDHFETVKSIKLFSFPNSKKNIRHVNFCFLGNENGIVVCNIDRLTKIATKISYEFKNETIETTELPFGNTNLKLVKTGLIDRELNYYTIIDRTSEWKISDPIDFSFISFIDGKSQITTIPAEENNLCYRNLHLYMDENNDVALASTYLTKNNSNTYKFSGFCFYNIGEEDQKKTNQIDLRESLDSEDLWTNRDYEKVYGNLKQESWNANFQKIERIIPIDDDIIVVSVSHVELGENDYYGDYIITRINLNSKKIVWSSKTVGRKLTANPATSGSDFATSYALNNNQLTLFYRDQRHYLKTGFGGLRLNPLTPEEAKKVDKYYGGYSRPSTTYFSIIDLNNGNVITKHILDILDSEKLFDDMAYLPMCKALSDEIILVFQKGYTWQDDSQRQIVRLKYELLQEITQ